MMKMIKDKTKKIMDMASKKAAMAMKPSMKSSVKNSKKLAQSAQQMEIYNSPKYKQMMEEEKQRQIQDKVRRFRDNVEPSKDMTPSNRSRMYRKRYFA